MPYDERGTELMTQAIERDPFDPVLYFYRGRIAYNLIVRKTAKRHYDMAVADLEKALRGRPQDARISEILGLCLVQFSHGFSDSPKAAYARAKELLDDWLTREPNNTAALAILADWQTRNSPLKAVVETCEKGQRLDPSYPEFLLFLGWGYRLHGQFQNAIDCFTRAIEMQPEPYKHVYPMGRVDLHAARAQVFALLGDEQATREDLGIGATWDSKERWTFYDWNELTCCYLLLKDFEEVVRCCSEWLQVAPECGRAYRLRAKAYLEMGKLEKAHDDVARIVTDGMLSSKSQASICTNVSWKLATASEVSERDPGNAVKLAKLAIELQSENANHWNNLGVAQYLSGNCQAAIEALEKADAMLEEGDRAHRMFLAMAHWQLGDKEKARELYAQGAAWIAADRKNDEEQNRFRAEAEHLMEVTEEDRKRLVEEYHAAAHSNLVKSLADYARAIELEPDNWRVWRRRGKVHEKLDQWDKAIADFSEAIRLTPENPT